MRPTQVFSNLLAIAVLFIATTGSTWSQRYTGPGVTETEIRIR